VPGGDGQYGEARERMILDARISRRRFLQMGAGAAAGALLLPVLPETARAGTLVDPTRLPARLRHLQDACAG
jgi:hypothetical protein